MRSDFLKLGLLKEQFLVTPETMESMYKIFNTADPLFATVQKEASNSVTYEKVESVAVISVDGAMYKKDMSGMCMSVASYQVIMQYIATAENDNSIQKILFRVTTPGGAAAGIDPLEEMIASCSKETTVIFEDIGASAGIYAFSACDKMYATEMTEVGSIGVVAGFVKKGSGDEVEYITSSRAKNKVTDLSTKEGKAKYIQKLDKREEKFYQVVEKNTGFDSEKIQEVFHNGETIFAQEAFDAEFLDGVTTFQLLLDSMVDGIILGVNPTSEEVKASALNQNLTQGESMSDTYTKEKFEELELSHAEALKGVNDKLTLSATALKEMTAEKSTLSEKLSVFEARDANMTEVVAMAISQNVPQETMLSMLKADSMDSAKAKMVDSMKSDGGYGAGENGTNLNAGQVNWNRTKKLQGVS